MRIKTYSCIPGFVFWVICNMYHCMNLHDTHYDLDLKQKRWGNDNSRGK
jgi:hypothetical protein